jgi:citrate lyase subunit beta/citryl-CoA lyase
VRSATTDKFFQAMGPCRSILFVPALNEKFVQKACTSAADVVLLDLEDSVQADNKDRARTALANAVVALKNSGKPVFVRVNQPIQLAVLDIDASIRAGVQALMLPKVLGASHVQLLDRWSADCESRHGIEAGTTRFLVVLETPEAYLDARRIAHSSGRIVGMMLGSEDFSWECECEPEEEVMRSLKQQVIVAACSAGVRPLGTLGSIANFRDLVSYEAMVRRSRAVGFRGTTCIHPSQTEVINRVYVPDAREVSYARRVIQAAEQAGTAGEGAFALDGRMIDAPIIARAKNTLDQLPK